MDEFREAERGPGSYHFGMPEIKLLGRSPECETLDQLLDLARSGESSALVLSGERGIGKSALLEYVVEQASEFRIVRVVGVESERKMAYASLHQLCEPLLGRLDSLPGPQHQSLEVVFGLNGGPAPDRFLVALAALRLLSELSEEQPVLCVVENAQWLDQSSALTLAFVARRLSADPVGLVFAARKTGAELEHLPRVDVRGLRDCDARALLRSAVRFALDEQVQDRIVAETRGNPLALLMLARALSATELAGFGAAAVTPLPTRLEESVIREITVLPQETRRLLLLAAADPLGDPILVWRAAELQGIGATAWVPAVEAGLCEVAARIRFRDPLVRAAAYGAGSMNERRAAHAAIADVTDPKADPDRRAWHRALAARGPDEAVADELERSARRAWARGGQAAMGAFLERSVDLTLDPGHRAERALAAAEARYLAGSAEDALRLAALAERGPLTQVHQARVDVLRGRVAMMRRHLRDAPTLLLRAAQRLERLDRRAARDAYRDAFTAARYAGPFAGRAGPPAVAAHVRSAAPSTGPLTATDELLDAAALLVDAGYRTGATRAQRAVAAFRAEPMSGELEPHWLSLACHMAQDVWDDDAWDHLTARMLELVRDAGVIALLPTAVAMRVGRDALAGDLIDAAMQVAEEDRVLMSTVVERSTTARIVLAAYRGGEHEFAQLDKTTTGGAVARGDAEWLAVLHWSKAVLCNGLGRYEEALAAARLAAAHPTAPTFSNSALSELVEAAARCGQPDAGADAVARLTEMARACGTEWILGAEARARALLGDPADADELYRQAIEHLARTVMRSELARAHLLYGEWLRREGRRVDAREHLRTAHEMLMAIGMEAFAERARRELLATGETARKRVDETRDELTSQEALIARLACDGLSNPEIGTRLFISPRTVKYHLHKVFIKLDITTRSELAAVLPGDQAIAQPL